MTRNIQENKSLTAEKLGLVFSNVDSLRQIIPLSDCNVVADLYPQSSMDLCFYTKDEGKLFAKVLIGIGFIEIRYFEPETAKDTNVEHDSIFATSSIIVDKLATSSQKAA